MLLGKCTTPVMRCNDGLMAGFNTFEKKKERTTLHVTSFPCRFSNSIFSPFYNRVSWGGFISKNDGKCEAEQIKPQWEIKKTNTYFSACINPKQTTAAQNSCANRALMHRYLIFACSPEVLYK